jgi:hypothetical protein
MEAHVLPLIMAVLLILVVGAFTVGFCLMHGALPVVPTPPVPPAHCTLPVTCQ